jgi:collagenase-like PrtC family protease
MHPQRILASPTPRSAAPARVRYLHAVAAARVSAARPASQQQIADIVRVTVDDEVDTRTFAAIVTDVSGDVRR